MKTRKKPKGGWRAKQTRARVSPRPAGSDAGSRKTRHRLPARETAAPGFAVTGRKVYAALLLGLLTALSYFPATQAGFVWDDLILTTLKAVQNWNGILDIWFAPNDAYGQGKYAEGHYWPLLYTTFWLEHKLWGFTPAGYHVVNILLHFVNTVLLWRVLLLLAVPGAWFAAAVFALHPLHVESVAWIIARKDLLSALFYLAAVMVWFRFVESPRVGRYVLALALFVAGMLCKSIVVTLPAALLIWHWRKQGRVTPADLLRLLPFFLAGLAIAVADVLFYKNIEAVSFDYSMVERTLIAAHALCFYAGKLLWPTELAVIYPRWDIDVANPLAWGYVIAVAVVAAALWFFRRRIGRGPASCVAFFAVTLSPALGFIDYGYMQFSFVADRYQYLAGIGIIALFVGAAASGADKLPRAARKGVPVVALAALLPLGAATWNQSGIYKDQITFFSHIVALNPQARGAHRNLSLGLYKQGRFEESLAAARIAVEKFPDSYQAHKRMGVTLLKLGRFEEAENYLRSSLEIEPRDAKNLARLGKALIHQRRFEEAENHLRGSLEIEPRNAKTLTRLGKALAHQGRFEESLEPYRTAVGIDPGLAPAHVGIGDSLFRLKRYREATDSLKQAVTLEPGLSATPFLHYLAGRAAQETNRPGEAKKHYQRALATNPHFEDAIDRLAGLWFAEQRYKEALGLYQRLVEIEPDNAVVHSNVGTTLFKMGETGQAVRSFERALSLDPTLETTLKNLEQARKIMQKDSE